MKASFFFFFNFTWFFRVMLVHFFHIWWSFSLFSSPRAGFGKFVKPEMLKIHFRICLWKKKVFLLMRIGASKNGTKKDKKCKQNIYDFFELCWYPFSTFCEASHFSRRLELVSENLSDQKCSKFICGYACEKIKEFA